MAESLEFLRRIKRLAIIAMFSDDSLMERLVLKGGNLLDIVYEVSTRSSVDIDLSLDGEFESVDDFRSRVELTLKRTFQEEGYVAFDVNLRTVPEKLSDDMKPFWGGYKIDFKIIDRSKFDELKDDIENLRRNALSVGKKGSTKFSIDVSKHEYCGAKQQRDLDEYRIYVYSPEMLVCEKLRAICQQMPEYVSVTKSNPSARARDFVDVHTVAERFSVDFRVQGFQEILYKTFEIKRVPLGLIQSISEYREYHREDFVAVVTTVKPGGQLHDFDFYFDYVIEKCRVLEPLWNE